MKTLPKPVIAIALAMAIFAGWWLTSRGHADDRWLGYVEGEAMYIAAPVSGRLQTRAVERGASVDIGVPLFALDPETVDASLGQAEAQLAASNAQAEDLEQAKQRQAEIDVWRASVAAASAVFVKARADYSRVSALADHGFASKSQLDTARAARDGAQANLAQMQAQIRASELSAGREGQIRAARAGIASAESAVRGQRKLRADIAPLSPAKGVIEQTYYNPGEWVPANSPIVAVLPDNRRKLRFFVPQDRVAALKAGDEIAFTCDGCGAGRRARISYISPRSEYTPPVIYSERARAKLVFMAEALLAPSERPLPLGLPVAVVPR